MDRTEKLRSLVNTQGFGLEIGPSHNPIFPKKNFNVEILDYTNADGLRSKYESLNIDTSRIEEVDYIASGQKIHEVIPRRGEYDYIFSSHTIEHVPDFLGYIQSCEILLRPGGVIAFAVPDKRYMFDAFQQLSTTGQVLEAYYRRQKRHSPASAYDFIANFARMDGREIWSKNDSGEIFFSQDLFAAHELLRDSVAADGAYHDVHGWVFTPSSFRLIMQDLKTLGLISVDEIFMREEDVLEFHVSFSSEGRGHGISRHGLHMNMMKELRAMTDQFLAPK